MTSMGEIQQELGSLLSGKRHRPARWPGDCCPGGDLHDVRPRTHGHHCSIRLDGHHPRQYFRLRALCPGCRLAIGRYAHGLAVLLQEQRAGKGRKALILWPKRDIIDSVFPYLIVNSPPRKVPFCGNNESLA